MAREKVFINVGGMHCSSCEKLIENSVKKLDGVHSVKASYPNNCAVVEFNPNKVSESDVLSAIDSAGYSGTISVDGESDSANSAKFSWNGFFYILLGIAVIVFLGSIFLPNIENIQLPELNEKMALGTIFLVGILTSFHCVAMCGPFVLSYSTKNAQNGAKLSTHLQYGVGKLISYTVIGGVFGLVGSVIAFTPTLRGIAALLAGIFLILYGLNMLNIFPILRKLQMRQPAFITKFSEKNSKKGPFFVGLMNGLMIACGPLQAMYVLAAATGSVITGAIFLFVFGLGTTPLMMLFGTVITLIGKALTSKILKYSGIIVIFLGILMLGNAFALMGINVVETTTINQIPTESTGTIIKDSTIGSNVQEIKMVVDGRGFTPNKFELKKGVKTKWVIDAQQLTSCNREIIVPALNLDIKLQPGIQTIEFTPTQEGVINWSCWMGMLRGAFLVQSNSINADSLGNVAGTNGNPSALDSLNIPKGSSCGGSGGGCGCGSSRKIV